MRLNAKTFSSQTHVVIWMNYIQYICARQMIEKLLIEKLLEHRMTFVDLRKACAPGSHVEGFAEVWCTTRDGQPHQVMTT